MVLYKWYPHWPMNPFIQKIISHENNTIVFDGYFYVRDFPCQRILIRYGEKVTDDDGNSYRTKLSCEHVEISEKISGEDTSPVEPDDCDEENINFFPTEITTIKYRVLKSNLSTIECKVISEQIKEADKLCIQNLIDKIVDE